MLGYFLCKRIGFFNFGCKPTLAALLDKRPFVVPPRAQLSPLLVQQLQISRSNLQRISVNVLISAEPTFNISALTCELQAALGYWVVACLATCLSLQSRFANLADLIVTAAKNLASTEVVWANLLAACQANINF